MEIRNRSASYEYYIEERYDAGMVLSGTEVKSIRDGKVSFNDSFCLIDKGEIWVKNLHIAEYTFGTYANHPAVRDRKLLLKKKEIRKLINKLKGRVSQLHLKDLKDGLKLPTFATGLPKDAFQELGDGIIPMEPIIVAAKAAGVVHCHVEQDQSPDPLASIRQSAGYLRKL